MFAFRKFHFIMFSFYTLDIPQLTIINPVHATGFFLYPPPPKKKHQKTSGFSVKSETNGIN